MSSEQSRPGVDVNPYAAPEEASVHLPAPDRPPAAKEAPLRFWEGRRALLQSLFYIRCFAIVTALLALRGLIALFSLFRGNDFLSGQTQAQLVLGDPYLLLSFLLNLVSVGVALYVCYVVWQYARRLQAVAGMHERDPTALCYEHLWLWKLKLLVVAIAIARELIGYLQSPSFASSTGG